MGLGCGYKNFEMKEKIRILQITKHKNEKKKDFPSIFKNVTIHQKRKIQLTTI